MCIYLYLYMINYSQGLNDEQVSISTEGKGDQRDQNPSEKLHGTNKIQTDSVIGHSQRNKKKERQSSEDKT